MVSGYADGWGYPMLAGNGDPPGVFFKDLAAGNKFSLGVTTVGGYIKGWSTGVGCVTCTASVPSPPCLACIPQDPGFVAVAAGWDHGFALHSDGSLRAWSSSTYAAQNLQQFGQYWTVPADPLGPTTYTAIAAGEWFNLALRSNGTIRAWGLNDSLVISETPPPTEKFTAIAAGGHHGVALRSNGTIAAWGGNYGTTTACLQPGMTHPGDVPPGLVNTGFLAVGAGHTHSYGILANSERTIVGWGCRCAFDGMTLQPGGYYILGTNGAMVTGGYEHGAALTVDGNLLAWGSLEGGCNDPVAYPTPYPAPIVAPPYQNRIVLSLGRNNVGRHNVFLYQPPTDPG